MDKEIFYYDKKNQLYEYFENNEDYYAEWINYFLTLYYSQKNSKIIGFSITWLEELLKKGKNSEEKDKFYFYNKALGTIIYLNENEIHDKKYYRKNINKYLTLFCDKKNNNKIGFEINGLNKLLKKEEEQKNKPLTLEEEKNLDLMYKIFEEKE